MCEVGEVAPRSVETHTGQVWVHVMRRSVRSCRFVSARSTHSFDDMLEEMPGRGKYKGYVRYQ